MRKIACNSIVFFLAHSYCLVRIIGLHHSCSSMFEQVRLSECVTFTERLEFVKQLLNEISLETKLQYCRLLFRRLLRNFIAVSQSKSISEKTF